MSATEHGDGSVEPQETPILQPEAGNKVPSSIIHNFSYPEFESDILTHSTQGDPEPILLQFRPWLSEKISSGQFLGLEWLDSDKKRIFKIPWTKMHHPNWQDHHEIFKAWSQYRGKFDNVEVEPSYSQTKSNFRTLLRKCADIEEMQGYHQMGLQTGNYKVYRILSQEETREKRRNMKKSKKNMTRQYVTEDGKIVKQVTIKRSITVTTFPEGTNSNKKYVVSHPSTCIAIPLSDTNNLDMKNLPELASKIFSNSSIKPVKKLPKKFLQTRASGDSVVLATGPNADPKSLEVGTFKTASSEVVTPNAPDKNETLKFREDEKKIPENGNGLEFLGEGKHPSVEVLENLGVKVGTLPIKVEIEDCIINPPAPKTRSKKKDLPAKENSVKAGNGAFELLLQAAEIAEERNTTPKPKPIISPLLTPIEAPAVIPPLHPLLQQVLTNPVPKPPPKPQPSILDVLKELHIPMEELFCYIMHVRYETKPVMVNVVLSDMSYGYRLRYGKDAKNAASLKNATGDCTNIMFPDAGIPEGFSLYTVLENMEAGLVVKSDKSYSLHGKRLCLSRIFAFTAYDKESHNTEPVALSRDQDLLLFSYQEFLKDWHRFLVEGGTSYPNIEVNLAFGKKPRHRHSRVFVAVTLIPKAAESMMRKLNTDYSSKQTDACFDNVLKLFK